MRPKHHPSRGPSLTKSFPLLSKKQDRQTGESLTVSRMDKPVGGGFDFSRSTAPEIHLGGAATITTPVVSISAAKI
jgi:hypothetical protein